MCLMAALFLFLFSCTKDDALPTLEEYIRDRNLSPTKTSSGLQYVITKEGNGQRPTRSSVVFARYVGTLTDGSVFDSNSSQAGAQFRLDGVIRGWQEGIPLIDKGGSAILLIPSNLGYGPAGSRGVIPPNADLVFSVEVIDFLN